MSSSTTRDSSQSRGESELEKAIVTPPQQPTLFSPVHHHLNAEINAYGVDIVILLCWFTTGFLDSTIFNAYRTFVSMQTGNTVFIGLGASANTLNRPYNWLKSLCSLIAFVLGCFFFSRLATALGSLKRRTFVLSFAIQTSLLLVAAVLAQTRVVESRLEYLTDDFDWLHLIPIVLLSFQAPGQTCMGRQVGLAEVPTVVVTTMVYDFASDERLFARLCANAKRNRRFMGFVMMLIGAITGGGVTGWTKHIVAALWVSTVTKGLITGAWMVWPRKRVGEGGDGER